MMVLNSFIMSCSFQRFFLIKVEAAHGAEEMVEQLTENNLELEMRVRELEDVGIYIKSLGRN
jgi:hypothetical protein